MTITVQVATRKGVETRNVRVVPNEVRVVPDESKYGVDYCVIKNDRTTLLQVARLNKLPDGGTGPAETAGICVGDLIIAVNGVRFKTNPELANALKPIWDGKQEVTFLIVSVASARAEAAARATAEAAAAAARAAAEVRSNEGPCSSCRGQVIVSSCPECGAYYPC